MAFIFWVFLETLIPASYLPPLQHAWTSTSWFTLLVSKVRMHRSREWIQWFEEFTVQFSSVQSLIPVWLFVTPWTIAQQASLSITNSKSLLKFMSIESVMPSNHLILCRPLLLQPSIFPSIRVIFKESVLPIRWPKYGSFSFNISPPKEYSGLISFRIDSFDLLTIQGTLKSLLQHHSSKAFILQCSAFFIVQLSHSEGYIFPFPLSLASLLFSAICKASSDNHLPCCISVSWELFWSSPPVQCYEPPSIVLKALCLQI